jgi:predicted dehydrogenase
MYYGALMDKHNPALLVDPMQGKGKGHYTWQSGGAHFYFYTFYADRYRMMVPQVRGFKIVKVWDEYRDAAEMCSNIFYDKPQVCRKFEEVSDDVDLVFIADCNGDGSDHLKLAAPGLTKGVPTFIDKPFAYTVHDALKLIELAQKKRCPLLSLSILSMVPQAVQFHNRLAEIAPVEFGIVKGFGGSLAGIIHTISLAQRVFGGGVKAVECMGSSECAHILLDYGNRPDRPRAGVMLNCDSGGGWHSSMYSIAYSANGEVHSPRIGDFEFPYGAIEILKLIKKMVISHKPPVDYKIIVENIAVAEAARKSQKMRKKILL